MASDYDSIRGDNKRRYGTDIKRIGQMLLADRYDDRTHFIFELLQNAEDALARRPDRPASPSVNFLLSPGTLKVSHFGQPFDDRDVRGICGIAESTKDGPKDLTAIGRFGIGFKSVYTFTEHPEVHSGDEDFAIESFVWPIAVPPIDRKADETTFLLPLEVGYDTADVEIVEGLRRLGPRALLFLRHIEEIDWHVEDGPSGFYMRSTPEEIENSLRRITLVGDEDDVPEVEQTWLVFSREIRTEEGGIAGHAEVAFLIGIDEENDREQVEMVNDSSLVVFFPTVVPTHLGFLLQGPYRTTPSRDNVPYNDPWNQKLIRETATLLVEALCWLRDHELMDTGVLRCLPLDRAKFPAGSMFAPLYGAVRDALEVESLLPRFGGGHVPANSARLAGSQELRELLGHAQLASLFNAEAGLAWLTDDISQFRTPELWKYLTQELGISEVTPGTVLSRLDATFLEAQDDGWILRLYEFLNGQSALLRQRRVGHLPLVRLEDGSHVAATTDDKPSAFLPGPTETEFPTVRRAVCATDEAKQFLRSLGLTEPDPVDDVVKNVLSRYVGSDPDVDDGVYEADIRRLMTAFATDSQGQRDKLIGALRDAAFVRAVDAGDASKLMSKPGEVYLATERLSELFGGVEGVLFVDDTCPCLRGEDARQLLLACGVARSLQPVPITTWFTEEERRKMRRDAGWEASTGGERVEDVTLRGLDELFDALPDLDAEAQKQKTALLWQALRDVETYRGAGAFSGTYHWFYRYPHSASFDAGFVRALNDAAWISDAAEELRRPGAVLFEALEWKAEPFLLSKIHFKPPIIETLAKEAGLDPGVLDLLKNLGVTSVTEFESRFGIEVQRGASGDKSSEEGDPDVVSGSGENGLDDEGGPSGDDGPGEQKTGDVRGRTGLGDKPREDTSRERTFVSYVSVRPDKKEPDPDGLDHERRMALEQRAIQLIIESEPQLRRTPVNNPGYDLYESGPDGHPERWVEVKSMTGSLNERPVGLSHTQFDLAREKGEAYWLYVVERAGAGENARLVRIQDPAGKTQTFTFDRGWLDVAEPDGAVASEHERG